MNDGRKAAQDVVRELLAPLDGARVLGGCDYCNAYQVIRPLEAGMWDCTVHHDDDCPWYLARHQRRHRS